MAIKPQTDFHRRNVKQWEDTLKELFSNEIPVHRTWYNKNDIVQILNAIGSVQNLCHLFMPEGGGLDLVGSQHSNEEGCIELNYSRDTADIVKPFKLDFYSFGNNYEWAYFRLELNKLEPSGIYPDMDGYSSEELTELSPGVYVDRFYLDEGYYNGEKLPEGTRCVSRYFEGTFVIFAKGSIYNRNAGTYDGRQNRMTDKEFYEMILDAVNRL